MKIAKIYLLFKCGRESATGRLDGNFGDKTELAVAIVQRAGLRLGIYERGKVDKATWKTIYDSINRKNYSNIIEQRDATELIADLNEARNEVLAEIVAERAAEEAERANDPNYNAHRGQMIADLQRAELEADLKNSKAVAGSEIIDISDTVVIVKGEGDVTVESILKNIKVGMYDTGKGTVEGIVDIIKDPIGTAKNTVELIFIFDSMDRDPYSMLKATQIISDISDQVTSAYNEFAQGDANVKAYYISRVGSEVLLTFVGTKGVDKISKTVKLGRTAEILESIDGGTTIARVASKDVLEFEEKISKMNVYDRVAVVREKLRDLAKNKYGWDKQNDFSRINNRDVFIDRKNKLLYSIDTQHGRFEKFTLKGKHLGEYDIDFNYTKEADISGEHDLIVN